MTAEIAIANAGAIALAADSAITIGKQKIYNSALKLFSLSKIAPVGVMIYGNASLLEVPWEILIKAYRNQLGRRVFSTLEQYATGFVAFLDNSTIFSAAAQQNGFTGNVYTYFGLIKQELIDEIHPLMEAAHEVKQSSIIEIFSRLIETHHDNLSQEKFIEGMNQTDFRKVHKQYKSIIENIRVDVFNGIEMSPSNARRLCDIAVYLHVKQVFGELLSGVVIAGYGESEIYPSIITLEFEGVIENRPRYRRDAAKSQAIHAGEGLIIPFAQDDMVQTFMQGINPSVLSVLDNSRLNLPERLSELLDELQIQPAMRETFKTKSAKLLRDIADDIFKRIDQKHIQPVLDMVTILPKDELAAMAETLVNLTAFKRRITAELESVGGPIDVAVISKGDGLVWVKRKHYFPPQLNQHFFTNYFREVDKP